MEIPWYWREIIWLWDGDTLVPLRCSGGGVMSVFSNEIKGGRAIGGCSSDSIPVRKIADGLGLGYCLDMEGDILAVSAPFSTKPARRFRPAVSHCGSVLIYEKNRGGTDNWGFVKEIYTSDADVWDMLYAVSLSGHRLVAGAHKAEAQTGHNHGLAYVFYKNHGGTDHWGEVKKLQPSRPDTFGHFGAAVAIDGDLIAVAAPQEAHTRRFSQQRVPRAGAVYLFQKDAGGTDNWGEIARLTASDYRTHQFFGMSVAIQGDLLIVGCPYDTTNGFWSGAVYFYKKDHGGTNNWGQWKKIIGDTLGRFGTSLNIQGNRIAVGAPYNGPTYYNPLLPGYANGAVYVYERHAGGPDNWGPVARCTVSTPPTGRPRRSLGGISRAHLLTNQYNSGFSGPSNGVSLSGNELAAGAPSYPDTAAIRSGAFLFDLPVVLHQPEPLPQAEEVGPAYDQASIAPNPSNGSTWLHLPSSDYKYAQAECLDVHGHAVLRRQAFACGTTSQLKLKGAPPGLYFLRITWPNGHSKVLKLVLQAER